MAMPLRLMSITDKKLTVFSAGPKSNFEKIEMFIYFCSKKETLSGLANFLDNKEIDVRVWRYDEIKDKNK